MRFAVILLMILTSCHGLTRSDREYIRIRIESHNIAAQVRYIYDLHNETVTLIYKYGHAPEDDSMKAAELQAWKARWNDPYWINRDTALTVDRFLDYCNIYRLNPRKYIDDIDIRYLQP